MNTDKFTGRAQAYAEARPGYPDEAIKYIGEFIKPDVVFADIGAGTGKFTELIARCGHKVFAVEPNADMREQLYVTLTPFPNAKIVDGTAETTTLPDGSVDVITCAQALGWFDLNAFRAECRRIGKPGVIVVSLYNYMPGDDSIPNSNRLTSKQATDIFFKNPAFQEFSNTIYYTRGRYLRHWASISENPRPFDTEYNARIAEANAVFDRESVDGLVRCDMVTKVFIERIDTE